MSQSAPNLVPRVPRWLMVTSGGAIASAATWAFWPCHSLRVELPDAETSVPPSTRFELPVLEATAFNAPLWVAEAPPPPPPPAPPAPPPLRLQLIAIVHEEGRYLAALYDPDKDELRVVASGEEVGARTVDEVTRASVRIREGQLVRTLALDPKTGSTP